MRWDLIFVFVGVILYGSGQHLIGGILLGAGLAVAIRSK